MALSPTEYSTSDVQEQLKIVIQCSGMVPKNNFTAEVCLSSPDSLRVWKLAEARSDATAGKLVRLAPGTTSGWCEVLRRLRMPAISASEIILDAQEYVVRIDDGATVARYSWAGKAPAGWGGLAHVVENIVRAARRRVD